MAATAGPRFRRDRQGRFRVGLEGPEQQLLSMLPRQVQELLEQDDPSTARVFPVAYTDDARAEADYREMMGAQLLQQHQRSLDTLAATAGAASIDEAEIHEWLDALEVLRLVLGTQLDVSEDGTMVDDTDPRAQPSSPSTTTCPCSRGRSSTPWPPPSPTQAPKPRDRYR